MSCPCCFTQDHVATFRACMAATRPASAGARHLVPYVLAYDNTTAFWAAPIRMASSDWVSRRRCRNARSC